MVGGEFLCGSLKRTAVPMQWNVVLIKPSLACGISISFIIAFWEILTICRNLSHLLTFVLTFPLMHSREVAMGVD